VPGLPTVPFLIFAAGTAITGNFMSRRVKDFDKATEEQIENEDQVQQQAKAVEERPGLRGEDLFVLDKLELEIGYGLIPLVDEARGGDLLHRIGSIRRQVGSELGIFIHPVRVRDNLQLSAQEYVIKLKGVEVARAQLIPGRLLAMSTRPDCGPLEGMATTEPAFNLPAVWIDTDSKSRAEMEGYTVVEPAAVLATHLSELIRAHADEMLSRQDVKDMCESMREFAPSLVEDLIPDRVPINTLHNVLRALLHERVPVRDLTTILETLANQGATAHGPDFLVARVREALARSRTKVSWAAAPAVDASGPAKPSPLRRATFSARDSHHIPKPSMMPAAMKPRPGAANGVVPKNGIGIAFWIAGEPGSPDIVKVVVPSITAPGSSRFGMLAARNSACPIGASTNIATKRLTPP